MGGVLAAVCELKSNPVLCNFLLAGGTLGSILAAWKTHGQFKPVALVILEDMSPLQQAQLAESCMKIIQDFRVEDVAILLPLLLNNSSAQQALMNQLISYVTNEMKLKIID